MQVNRYELGEILFDSPPSTFYLGRNALLGSEVLVRRLEIDPARAENVRETFYREQRHMAALGHPRIMSTLDVFEEDGALWSVHPYSPARPTQEIVEEHGPFAIAEAARIGAHVADALSHLHARDFVHGRINPDFVLVDERGDVTITNLVKSADLAGGGWPLREAVRGVGPFSAPEEWDGERTTPESDLFSLAATFLYWIEGQTTEIEGIVQAFRTHGSGRAPDLKHRFPIITEALADALEGALVPDPKERRGSAAALAALFSELERQRAAEVPAGFETGTLLQSEGCGCAVVLEGRIGAGRYGVVLRAGSPDCGGGFAVKALKPEHRDDKLAVERFVREAQALHNLRHPNVVHVHGVGTQRGMPYVVMDFLDGPDLSTLLRRTGVLEPARAAAIGLEIACGLDAIHSESLLHRDLKPANVMMVGGEKPVITDLGVAKALAEETLTMTGALIGTPMYMSPEQAWGKPIGPTADLYALGAVLYECLSGAPPLTAPDLMGLLKVLRDVRPAPLPDDVPAALAGLTMRLLEKNPSQRPQTAKEVIAELGEIVADLQ
jgi:serine/threonine protein kinase